MFSRSTARCEAQGRHIGGAPAAKMSVAIGDGVEALKTAEHPRVSWQKILRGISNFLFAATHISIHNAPGSAQASRRVTDLATAPTPHFPGVGATLFLERRLSDSARARANAHASVTGSSSSAPGRFSFWPAFSCDRTRSPCRIERRGSPCALPERCCRSFCGRGHRPLTTAIYRKLSAIGLTMRQGCAI